MEGRDMESGEKKQQQLVASLNPSADPFWPISATSPSCSSPYQVGGFMLIPAPLPVPPPPPQTPQYAFYTAYPPCPALPSVIVPAGEGSFLGPPRRSLKLFGVPPSTPVPHLFCQLSSWGELRHLQTEQLFSEGVVVVHYFDLRSSIAALSDFQHCLSHFPLFAAYGCSSPPRGLIGGRPVSAQYTSPFGIPAPDRNNQGSLVVFNLASDVSNSLVHSAFQRYGDVREVRSSTASKRNSCMRFVEFFDTRAAAEAMHALDSTEVLGKRVKIEFSVAASLPRRPLRELQPAKEQERAGPAMPDSPPQAGGNGNKHDKTDLQASVSPPQQRYVRGRPLPFQGPPRQRRYGRTVSPTINPHSSLGSKGTRLEPVSDEYFKFNKEEASSGNELARTTLMIRNIPNKYSQQMLVTMLDKHCVEVNSEREDSAVLESSYDFLYLPIDFKNGCNLGYAFINFTSSHATLKFYEAFNDQRWDAFNSRKICEVAYARIQGKSAFEEHFRNSQFACDTDEYLPMVFSPPRTGVDCPSPRAVGNHQINNSEVDLISCPPDDKNQATMSVCAGGVILGRRLNGHRPSRVSCVH